MSVTPHTVERLGLHVIVYAEFAGTTLTCLFGGDPSLPEGEALTVHIPLSDIHVFDAAGNARTASR
jgi:multiple sugar transport system ATP-binding protein